MNSSTTQSGIFGFASKIVLLVLGMLLIYQSLGTLLSILSFENIYLKGLTVRYRIIGSDLKDEIEGALKFGKSLERFVGMDRIVSPLFGHHADLESIFLLGKNGEKLFLSGRAAFVVAQGGADIRGDGQRILTSKDLSFSTPALPKNFNWRASSGTLISQGEVIYLLFPIKPRFGDEAGVLGLAFNQKIFKKRRAQIIVSAGKLLALTLLLTLFGIGGCLYYFIFRPTRRQVDASCRLLENGLANLPEPGAEMAEELHVLQDRMAGMANFIVTAITDISVRLQDLRKRPDIKPQEMKVIKQMEELLDHYGEENRHQP